MSAEHDKPDLACQRVVEMVTDYLEGALPAEDAARLEQHLVLCDPCVQYVDQHKALIAALGQLSTSLARGDHSAPAASRATALQAFRKLRKEEP